MAYLEIRLFGPFQVISDGVAPSGFDSDKVRALLAYLAIEGDQPHRREKLAGLLWPEFTERSARTNLRRALANLRQVIGDQKADPPLLTISRQTIQFNQDSDSWVDVAAFLAAVTPASSQSPDFSELEEAVTWYRGALLEGFSLPDSAAFEEWSLVTRESLQRELLAALQRLTDYHLGLGSYEQALAYVRRQVEMDPYREEGQQQLMRLLALSGRRSEALAQFEAFQQLISQDLGVEPAADTKALFTRIRDGELSSDVTDVRYHAVRGYELRERLGTGNFGEVYRAYQPVVERDVAIKIIKPQLANHPDFIRRFEAEAQLVARLEHPHIVPLYDYWREPNGAFLVMRWLRGGSLQQALQQGPFSLAPAVQLVQQIAAAIQVAHHQGIIHRDIKPANILLDNAGNAYLADFGVATLVGSLDSLGQRPPATTTDDPSGSLGYRSPESIQQDLVTAATDIYSLGVVVYELLTAQHPFPEVHGDELLEMHLNQQLPEARRLRPELPPAVDEVIQKATAKVPDDRYANSLELAAALEAAITALPQPAPMAADAFQNPYKGLRPFQEADSADFYGRNALVERLLARMREDGTGSHFLALVGPSGSGKSSTIGAGLLPALRQGALKGSSEWFIVQMVPGPHPLDELEIALLRIAANQPSGLMEQLRRDERGLLRAASLVLPDPGSHLLLIIDQFEEIFTLASDSNESMNLLQLLVAAVTDPRSQVRILISLRADFYDRPLTHVAFGRLMQARTEVVVPMDAEEMSQAIYEPAVRAGVQLEPELMTTIVADVGQQPGGLPLLQYALTELFERRDGQRLTLTAYHEMGGVLGALGRRAEEIYQSLDKSEKDTTRQLLLRLVTLGEGLSNVQGAPDTRRRVMRTELEHLAVELSSLQTFNNVIDTFGRYRLLTFDRDPITRGPTIEVAHEALLREWDRLRQWLNESRDDIRQERAVSRAAEEWEQHDQDKSFLLHGARLEQVEEWRANSTLIQTPLVQRYITQSLHQRDEEQLAEGERREHELQLERRSKLFLRGLVAVFALATIISVALLFVAIGERQSALASAAEAQNVALIAGSQAAFADNDMDTALTLAWQAVALNPDSALAQSQLSEVAYAPGTERLLQGNEAYINRVYVSPDSKTVFGVGIDGVVILWDMETGQIRWKAEAFTPEELSESEEEIKVEGNDGGFSPDGQVVAASYDDRIMFWEAANGQLIRQVNSAALDQKVEFSPAGDQFVTIGKEEEGHLVFWDFASGQVLREIDRGSNIEEITYTADGSAILLASQAGMLTLLDAVTGDIIYEVQEDLGANAGPLFFIDISPDGTQLIANFSNAGVLIWDLATGNLLHDFRYEGGILAAAFHPHDGTVLTSAQGGIKTIDPQSGAVLSSLQSPAVVLLAISPDGKRVVTSALDGTVRLWDLQGGQVVQQYPTPEALLFEVALSPNGQTMLVASTDGSATLWDLESGEEIWRVEDDQPILAVAFSPDGRQALTGAGFRLAQKIESGHIILWDVETGQEIRRFEGHPYAVFDVDFSPDGRLAASAGNGAIAILWDVETGQEIRRFEDYWEDYIYPDNSYWSVEFSPDGQQLFASHSSGNVIAWDVESGEQIQQLEGHTQGGKIVFSKDGQRLVSGGADSQAILWDVPTGTMLYRFDNHGSGIGKVDFSADEALLLGGSEDGTSSLWQVETGEEIRRYRSGFVFSPSFTPDGRHAVVGYRDGAVELWRIDSTTDELISWVENNRYIPELTCDRRELYHVEPLCEETIEE